MNGNVTFLLFEFILSDQLADLPPYLKLSVKGVNSSLIYVTNESPFKMVATDI